MLYLVMAALLALTASFGFVMATEEAADVTPVATEEHVVEDAFKADASFEEEEDGVNSLREIGALKDEEGLDGDDDSDDDDDDEIDFD